MSLKAFKAISKLDDIEGCWDFEGKCEEPDERWTGFLCFFPDGTTLLTYHTGWYARDFTYEISEGKLVANIETQGVLTVEFNDDGATASGTLDETPMSWRRRHGLFNSLAEHAVAKWQLWIRDSGEAAAQLTVMEVTGDEGAEAGALTLRGGVTFGNDEETFYDLELRGKGHKVEGHTKVGFVRLHFSEDGLLLLATMGPTHFEGWRV